MITKNSTFGERLREFREDRKMSQLELSERAGMSNATLVRYENDLSEPKLAIAVRLAEVLETDLEFLIPDNWRTRKEIDE